MILSVFVTTAIAVLGLSQQVTCSRDVQVQALDTPYMKRPNATDPQVSVSTTTASTTNKDLNIQPCRCVPYYMCDGFKSTVHVINTMATGWGGLDTRIEDVQCKESVEKCCKNVIPINQVPALTARVASSCGYRNPKGVDENVGANGNDAEFGEFPWVMAILNSKTGEYGGAGVLIHPEVVMTAAHIASKFDNMTVRAGEWDTRTTKERLMSQERLVDKIILNPDFHPMKLSHDIALLHLKTPVQIDSHINIICLPEQNEDFDSAKSCYANGWGKDVFGDKGRYAAILKKVQLDMVPYNKCNNLLKNTRLGARFKLHESLICAGGEEGKDTCQGDGGGPLACPVGDDRYKLSGLVAWGISCGEENVPAVYVRVAMFMDWVDEVMSSWGLPTNGYRI